MAIIVKVSEWGDSLAVCLPKAVVDQVRSVHRPSRGFERLGQASEAVLSDVRSVLASLTVLPMIHTVRRGQP